MKKQNKWFIFFFIVVIFFFVIGCSSPADQQLATGFEESNHTFRIALVTPSKIDDMAFSQSMYEALMIIQAEKGDETAVEVDYSDGLFVVEDAATAIRNYADAGYDLVIAHGSQYGSSLVEIAPEYPQTAFAWGTTSDTMVEQGINNVFAYSAAAHEGGYVMGVMAAELSKSDVISVVGPVETGDAKLYIDGFVAGALAQNPDALVDVNYIGSFSDVVLAAEAAQDYVQAGADVMTGSSQMVVGAIGVARQNEVLWFGTQSDQASLAPEIVVASQVYHWEIVLRDIIESIQNGTRGGKAYMINLENEGEVVKFNESYDLSDEVISLADQTIQGIIDGSISIALP